MEEFRDFDDFYEISSLGNVKSKRTGKILRKSVNGRGRYKVNLCYNGVKRTVEIHRLVAKVFIPNPNNYPVINHKDENPLNNDVNNLEWCTQSYNLTYGNKRTKENITKSLKNSVNAPKIVQQFSLTGELINEFPSALSAGKFTGIASSHIRDCCNNKTIIKEKYSYHCRTAGGFIWKYKIPLNSGEE